MIGNTRALRTKNNSANLYDLVMGANTTDLRWYISNYQHYNDMVMLHMLVSAIYMHTLVLYYRLLACFGYLKTHLFPHWHNARKGNEDQYVTGTKYDKVKTVSISSSIH